jgi:serine/threonine protein kinase
VTATDGARLIAGRYLLISEVGRGAMGVVWLARDERLGRTVAVKELRPGVGLSGTQVRNSNLRARREARIAASLHHPHAVAVYDVCDHEDRPYLVMEYVASRSLAEVLVERTVLTPAEAVGIGVQLTSALVAAHEIGIVHRDIKPANILMTESGDAKLTDFGISRATGDVTVTATGEMLGTPAYVAPEIAQGRPASSASDVFSLGATLYAAVEGEPPFGTGPSAIALLLRIVNDEIRVPDRIGPLTDTLMWMLRNDPTERPTMEAAQRSLRAIAVESAAEADAVTISASPIAAPRPAPEAEVVDGQLEPADSGSGSSSGSGSGSGSDSDERAVTAVDSASAPASASGSDSGLQPTKPTRTTTSSSPGSRRRLLLPWWAWLGVSALVTAGIVAAIVAGSGPTKSNAAPPAANATATTGATPATTSSTKTTSPTATASPYATQVATPAATASASTSPSVAIATQLTSAISYYYQLVPGNLDQAFGYMTAYYQQNTAGGMSGYRAFWDPIQRVSVSNIVAQPPSSVTATIDYYYKDGKTVQERTRFGLELSGGIWKIAKSSVLSSTTL